MAMFSMFRKEAIDFFTPEAQQKIRNAIHNVEKNTSGEVRVYIEHYCKHEQAVHRATEIFHTLQMDKTVHHNGVLVYLAVKHKKLAIYGDAGINGHVNAAFWNEMVQKMEQHFKKENFTEGIVHVIETIGLELAKHYPYDPATDKNDLPDELVFEKK
jgi:uncharacterized membrane protein